MDRVSFFRQSWSRPLAAVCGVLLGVAALAAPTAAQTRAELVERGRYLVETIGVCGHCHTPQKLEDGRQVDLPGMHLAGGYGFDGPVLGRWVGANITSDPETGIGTWTEVQIAPAIREGRRPDGSIIGPPMPFAHYRKISDADAAAMAAYLKSVPPVRHVLERSSYRIRLPADWGPPVSGVVGPPADDPVARGAYLAEIGHCMDCHTPNHEGRWARLVAHRRGRPARDRLGRSGSRRQHHAAPGARSRALDGRANRPCRYARHLRGWPAALPAHAVRELRPHDAG